jgi:hypothetical protein
VQDSAAGAVGIVVVYHVSLQEGNHCLLKLRNDCYRAKFQHKVMINHDEPYNAFMMFSPYTDTIKGQKGPEGSAIKLCHAGRQASKCSD